MTLEHDSRLKFLRLLGYSRDELQKKVSFAGLKQVCLRVNNPAGALPQETWPYSILDVYFTYWNEAFLWKSG